MNIIYLLDLGLNKITDDGIPLSGMYFCINNWKDRKICISKNDHYVDSFWGRQIKDCFAIVGDNGAGKTVLANTIMEDIELIKANLKPYKEFLMIVEDNGMLSAYYTKSFEDYKFCSKNGAKFSINRMNERYWKTCEVAYFHTPLSFYDYIIDGKKCRYDFSLGKMIRRHHEMTFEMHYDGLEKDSIRNYFNNELFRIITFLYTCPYKNKLLKDFPWPKEIQISIADNSFNKEYIMKETKELIKSKTDKVSEDEINKFRNNVNNIKKVFGMTWINCTIENLVMNCYKELSIPTATSDRKIDPYIFFDVCELLGDIKSSETNIYECVSNIMKKLQQNKEVKDVEYIKRVTDFVDWLKKNEAIIKKFEKGFLNTLIIPINEETKSFIKGLTDQYSKMNFEFPFYDFSFHISTGEYYFLELFSNLYSMINKDINVYDYSKLDVGKKNVLLIFDEVEISMHPKWQRMFVKWLTDFCESGFRNISVKIIIITHSPILLSDIPANSILYVTKKEGEIHYTSGRNNTFGCNIHSLYLNSFFLDGTMGKFAEDKINDIANVLLQESTAEINYKEKEKEIEYIGEGIIKKKLKETLSTSKGREYPRLGESEKTVIKSTLEKLKEQRNYMNRLIEELEEKTNDKNRY